ncbi:MAG TPA: anti-sigma factor [Thermoanaerobaculia bacterium]|nr:anti-sigma factor [Thermoanaerobaculia bacterium]
MNQEVSSEDRTILTALESLERGSGEPLVPDEPGSTSDETAEMLARLYTEVLGLLPAGLEPVAPRPEERARLLAAVSGEPVPIPEPVTQEIAPRPAPAPRPASVFQEMPVAPAPPPRVAMVAAPPRRSWPLALAASLALVLGGLSGWLLQQRAAQQVTIETLRAELEGERRKAGQALAEANQVNQRMERMRTNFALVTAPAVTVIPLSAVGLPSEASGMLFVASDHQHWYMALHNLPPAEPGRDYQLWWKAKAGMVSGGTFDTRPGETMELSSETMPDDTRDVVITVEAEGGAPTPTGPMVLRALG